MKTSCEQIQTLLAALLFDELEASEKMEVERHLADCPACRAELDELRGAVAFLQANAPSDSGVTELSADRMEKLRAEIQATIAHTNPGEPVHGLRPASGKAKILRLRPRTLGFLGLAAAALLMLVLNTPTGWHGRSAREHHEPGQDAHATSSHRIDTEEIQIASTDSRRSAVQADSLMKKSEKEKEHEKQKDQARKTDSATLQIYGAKPPASAMAEEDKISAVREMAKAVQAPSAVVSAPNPVPMQTVPVANAGETVFRIRVVENAPVKVAADNRLMLESLGYIPVYLIENKDGTATVECGNFPTKAEAIKMKAQLEREGFAPTRIIETKRETTTRTFNGRDIALAEINKEELSDYVKKAVGSVQLSDEDMKKLTALVEEHIKHQDVGGKCGIIGDPIALRGQLEKLGCKVDDVTSQVKKIQDQREDNSRKTTAIASLFRDSNALAKGKKFEESKDKLREIIKLDANNQAAQSRLQVLERLSAGKNMNGEIVASAQPATETPQHALAMKPDTEQARRNLNPAQSGAEAASRFGPTGQDWKQVSEGAPTSQGQALQLDPNKRYAKTVNPSAPIPAGTYNSLGGPFKVYLRNRKAAQNEADAAAEYQRQIAAAPQDSPSERNRWRDGFQESEDIAQARVVLPPGGTPDAMYFKDYGVNPFVETKDDKLSTFSVEVDKASYVMARNYLNRGTLPPCAAIRVEEIVNYFPAPYPAPTENSDGRTFAVYGEMAPSPFGQGYHLLKIGIKGREIPEAQRKPLILTFVIDCSGSMQRENRLEMVKRMLTMLVGKLRPEDRIGIASFESNGHELLAHVNRDSSQVYSVIAGLHAGGSTNAAEGLQIGYAMARRVFDAKAVNRVILFSDGVANTGLTQTDAILTQISASAKDNIYLTAVGVGMGNYNDVLLEQLADKGNGHYVYIDNDGEAQKFMTKDLLGAIEVIAQDVKIQVEFNPSAIARYRLLGYENRDIADKDFRNDAVDAGEIGAGHAVTALYEVELAKGAEEDNAATVFVRYKQPDKEMAVKEIKGPIRLRDASKDFASTEAHFKLCAVAAEYAEILRNSYYARGRRMTDVAKVFDQAFPGNPPGPEAAELRGLIDMAERLIDRRPPPVPPYKPQPVPDNSDGPKPIPLEE